MIEFQKATVQAGEFVLKNVSLRIEQGEYGVLMGPTGCGKTTLLEAAVGLRAVASGRILAGGVNVTRLKPSARQIGYVPQDGVLFSAMTVAEHLAFPLRIRRMKPAEIQRRVDELADLLGISGLLDRRPRGLSGGERQRTALGRALSFRPKALLLDEPLSALDEETRERMYNVLKRVQKAERAAVLHVTHSSGEAAALADRVYYLKNGKAAEVERTGDVV